MTKESLCNITQALTFCGMMNTTNGPEECCVVDRSATG